MSSDSLLEEFFKEIEALTIHSKEEDDNSEPNVTAAAEDGAGTAKEDVAYPTSAVAKKSKAKALILERAEKSQKSWQEFSTASSGSTRPAPPDRPLVSFSLSKAKTKSKPKKSQPKQRIAKPLPTPSLYYRPRWIAVLDTCAVLESYTEVCHLLAHAHEAADRSTKVAVVEPISVVIPYKMWNELDYRSKKAGDEGYRERRALRRLNEELDNTPKCRQGRKLTEAVEGDILRAQSRTEMDQTKVDFFQSGSTEANNDDYILWCALDEQRRFQTATAPLSGGVEGNSPVAGGVVLLTLDKVLSGKARADGVTPYTPVDFVQYYRTRAASLRERTRLGQRTHAS